MKHLKYIALAFLLASCSAHKDPQNSSKIERIIKETQQEKRYSNEIKKIYFVNVDQGCESCIAKCLLFIKEQQSNPNILFFILSSYNNTLVKIKKEYSLNISADHNIIVDKGLLSNKAGLIDVFPVVYYLDNKEVVDHKLIDASNIEKILVKD